VAPVILVAEGHAALVEADQPAIRDGDAVCVAGEIGEHRLRRSEGRLGVDEPSLPLEWREVRGEGLSVTQAVEFAEERQPARCMGVGEPSQEETPNRRDSTRTGNRKPGRQRTQCVPSNDIPPPGTIMW